MQDTKAKTGKFIKLEFTILDGEQKGRKIWTNLNVVNPNPVAVEIAQKELATICRACGKLTITDTMELHGIPFLGKIKVRPASGDWPASNDMVNYKALEGGVPGVAKGAKPASADSKKGGVPWA